MIEMKLALRNLARQKKRTILLGGAIAFGIMVITLVNSFTAGAEYNVKENFSYLLAGHIYVEEQIRRDDDKVVLLFEHPQVVEETLAEIGIDARSVMRRSAYQGQFIFSGRSADQTVQGVNWERENALQERMILLEGQLEDIISDPSAVVLSEQVARRLGAEIGDELIVRMSTVTGQQNVGSLVIRGIMQDPGLLGSISAYAHLEMVNSHINIPVDSYQALHISIDRFTQVDMLTDQLHRALGERAAVAPRISQQDVAVTSTSLVYQDDESEPWTGSRFSVTNINDYLGQIEQISSALTITGMVILLVLIAIIMVGVINTFRMVMYERVKEIGTMRAVGMQRKSVKRLFLWEACFLALFGYLAGVVLALGVSAVIGFFPIPLENPFSLFTQSGIITFPIQLGSLAVNFLLITVLTVCAAWFPARKAARMDPAAALRATA